VKNSFILAMNMKIKLLNKKINTDFTHLHKQKGEFSWLELIKPSIVLTVLFTIYSFLAKSIFYFGFLSTFQKYNHLFFGEKTPQILQHIPYHSNSILFSALLHPFFLTTLVCFYIPLLWKNAFKTYKNIPFEKSEKLIVFIISLLLSWELCTYDYNFYLDHAFYLDRIVLMLFPFLLLRLPILTPLFIAFTYVYRSQFNFPVDGFELFDKQLLFDILILFIVHRYIKLFFPTFKIPFLYFVICIVASNYFMSGIAKIIRSPHGYEWLMHNNPSNLFFNVYARGWLINHENSAQLIANFLSIFGSYLQAVVLLLELSALFLLKSRKITITLLVFLICMHLGLFISGSMFFWKWIVVDGLIIYLLCKKHVESAFLFNRSLFYFSVVVIVASNFWLHPMMIAWNDTKVNQFFTYEVTDKSGNVYQFKKNDMNPYHQWFQYDSFLFLVNKPCLPISGFGYTHNYELANEINHLKNDAYFSLEQKKGVNHFNTEKKLAYDNFIRQYFKMKNKYLNELFIPKIVKAPNHLYSDVVKPAYQNNIPITSFRVIFNQIYNKCGDKIILSKKCIDEVFIP
jgi:hypothetical protein